MIQLSKDRGVNPRITFCPICGKDGNEILLLGTKDWIWKCNCGKTKLNDRYNRTKCECGLYLKLDRRLDEWERLPGSVCDECVLKQKDCNDLVANGGIHFRCKCGSRGAIRPEHELSKKVREKSGITTGPVGIELEKCPSCEEK